MEARTALKARFLRPPNLNQPSARPAAMLNSVFQNSKSALVFAGVVVVSTLMLVGTKDGGGVLDKAVTNYKDERANIIENAARVGDEMSSPVIGPYNPNEAKQGGPASAELPQAGPVMPGRVVETRSMVLSDLSQDGDDAFNGHPGAGNGAVSGPANNDVPGAQASPDSERREAVVTSRVVRIAPH